MTTDQHEDEVFYEFLKAENLKHVETQLKNIRAEFEIIQNAAQAIGKYRHENQVAPNYQEDVYPALNGLVLVGHVDHDNDCLMIDLIQDHDDQFETMMDNDRNPMVEHREIDNYTVVKIAYLDSDSTDLEELDVDAMELLEDAYGVASMLMENLRLMGEWSAFVDYRIQCGKAEYDEMQETYEHVNSICR